MILQAKNDHVIVKEIQSKEKTTKSWILVTWTDKKEHTIKWEVISIWRWKRLENGIIYPIDICVGDIVYFNKYDANEIEMWEETKYYAVREFIVSCIEIKE